MIAELLHHLFCPAHGVVILFILSLPFAGAGCRLAIDKLKR